MKNFIEYLTHQQALSLANAEKLAATQRMDESIVEKVRANIYGIFHTIAQMPDVTSEFMTKKMEQIPSAWHVSLENAVKHGDYEKETLERTKIAVMDEIKAAFDGIKGDFSDES